jgi:hypothetical protein
LVKLNLIVESFYDDIRNSSNNTAIKDL